jgi:signal transduction histidine kinase
MTTTPRPRPPRSGAGRRLTGYGRRLTGYGQRLSGYGRRLTEYGQRLADRGRALPALVVDGVISIGCFLTVAVMALVDHQGDWWVAGVAALNALPLLWRRRYPFTVTVVTGVTTTGLALVGMLGQFPAAQLVATYTFAALCPPVLRLLAVLGTVAGISISILVPHEEVLALGPVGIMFAVAYALGTGARARRDRIAMLEERARRLAEEHTAAATRERERIAREMHDILAHSMSLVVVQAEAGPVAVRSDPARAEEAFDTISATAREALAQLRRALGVLRSHEPDGPARRPQPGLDGLRPLVESVRHAGLSATLEEHGEPRPVPADLATTAYRIVQESLTNTVRHAAARSVRVRLDWRDRALHLEVRDDGRGPADNGRGPAGAGPGGRGHDAGHDAGHGGGHGLVGMRERVAALGGELTCGAPPDGVGFRVAASLPLQ